MVEDIMFVRRGILSVEMPINITNLEENIDKYKNMSILNDSRKSDNENEENSPIIKYNSKVYNSYINKTQGNNIKETFPGFNSILYGSGISPNLKKTTFGKKVSNTDKEKLKDEIIYVRIFCIRQNEHFGDVMMFLEQRSPLRIRVKSKQAQLFFLRKMDAIKISTSYPNIWRSINKKSIYNFKQIKRSINKIIEIYTSEQKIKEEEDKSSSFFSEIINKGKKGNEKTEIKLGTKKEEVNDLNNMIDEENIKIIDKKSKFQKSKSFKRKNKFERVGSNDFGNKEILNSKNNLDSGNPKMEKRKSILSIGGGTKKNKNNRRVKFDKKLDDVYKENYKFYKKVNKNPQKKKNSIIKEDPTNEDINSRFKSTKSFKNISKISFSQKSNKDSKKNSSKKK